MKTLIVHYHSFDLWHAPAWIRERLQQDFPGHQFVQLQNYDRVPEEIADTSVFIGWSLRPKHFVAANKSAGRNNVFDSRVDFRLNGLILVK
jgi:hypothetical protein